MPGAMTPADPAAPLLLLRTDPFDALDRESGPGTFLDDLATRHARPMLWENANHRRSHRGEIAHIPNNPDVKTDRACRPTGTTAPAASCLPRTTSRSAGYDERRLHRAFPLSVQARISEAKRDRAVVCCARVAVGSGVAATAAMAVTIIRPVCAVTSLSPPIALC
jgi:hypothetical protein